MIDSLAQLNAVLITLDCLRFDTAVRARTPFLDRLGPPRRALTYGTYTLPAHMSIFAGYLPRSMEQPPADYYSREGRQLWRLVGARHRDPNLVAIPLEGRDILDGYRRLGGYTLGVGGVRWFRNPTLTGVFDRFLFWGPDDHTDVFTPRAAEHFALNHPESIAEQLSPHGRWFLFLNCLETHAPYDSGEGSEDRCLRGILDRARHVWGGKDRQWDRAGLGPEDFALLHQAQVAALEVVDARLGRLFKLLDRPVLVVACGDHGEAFGENRRYGHGFPAPEVWEVPLWVGILQ